MTMNKIKHIHPHLSLLKTRKYKEINLYLRFALPYDSKEKAAMTILSALFAETSKKYPDKTSMGKARDMLYGLTVSSSTKSKANLDIFEIQYTFINPKFLKDVTIDDFVAYIKETLLNTSITKKYYSEAKRNLIANYKRKLDKPVNKAKDSVFSIICKDHPSFGSTTILSKDIQSLRKVKIEDVIKIYDTIIKKARLDVYVCGDVKDDIADKLSFIKFNKRKDVSLKIDIIENMPSREIIEEFDTKQSILHVLYTTPYNSLHKDFYAFVMGNLFLGVLPTSLLFEEVREKLSLCYSISVFDLKLNGLVAINTSIDGKNKDLVIDNIKKQINNIITKNYDPMKLEISKTLFMNVISSTYDDQFSLIDYHYSNSLLGVNTSIEYYAKKISEVTPNDLVRVFKNYKPYFIYMLEGKQNG